MSPWKRPESVPYPSIWREFEGKQTIDGRKRKFWIQDIPEDLIETVATIMSTHFLADEPLCRYSKTLDDQISVDEMRDFWVVLLQQKMGLICFTKDENGERKIVGMNCTYRAAKDEKEDFGKVTGTNWNRIIQAMDYVSKLKDAYLELNIDSYLGAMGLLVLSEFRGEGIGLEILHARRPLCLAVGIPASLTLFTSVISQKLAARAGFKDLVSLSYDELEKRNSFFSFPGISEFTKDVKFMYIVYN